jgi:hypothetical protein
MEPMEGRAGPMAPKGAYRGISEGENVFHYFPIQGRGLTMSAEGRILINMNVAGFR